jgi:hypothetical protein
MVFEKPFLLLSKDIKTTSLRGVGLIFVIFTLCIPYQSCKIEDFASVDCYKCFRDMPKYSNVKIKVLIDDEITAVPIDVYKGTFDNKNFMFTEVTSSNILYLKLENEVEYTLIAKYNRNGRPHYVVNRVYMKIKEDYESCNQPCFYVTGDEVDLRLKF